MPKKYIPTNIGFILNDIRERSKKTRYRVAKEIKMSRETIDAIENMRTNPSLHTFVNLMDYFDYDIEVVSRKNPDKKLKLKILKNF